MSYDIFLKCPVSGKALELDWPHQMKGGTYAVGGTNLAELNITWNYASIYHDRFGPNGIRIIYGKTGIESIPILKKAISQLGDDVNEDYWNATEGNAKIALVHLLALAQLRPDGIWDGD